MSTDAAELSSHLVRVQDVTCAQLDCSTAFAGLSQSEALYALHIHDASWAGAFICARQTSAEAVPLLCLLRLVWEGGYAPVAAALEAACGRDTLERFLAFSVEVISNLGNYKSFGDTKLVPDLPEAAFVALVRASPAYAAGHGALLEELWAALQGLLYSLAPRLRSLGLGADKGVSCYYSSDVTPAEAGLAHRWLASLGLAQAYNSRLFAVAGQGGERVLQLRLASAAPAGASPEAVADAPLRALLQAGVVAYEGALVQCVRGDHAPLMARVCSALQAAAPHAANATQRAMLARYVESFDSGSMAAHMAGSAEWVADKGPAVESYLGFIESYQDPMGVSGAWEGFVAVVNKETSKKFGALVAGATSLLPLLPWGPEYEKESFSKPDFTALEVLAFASGGVPAGINIPNYDQIRGTVGFKNVSLANVLSARDSKARVTFLADGADQALFSSLIGTAFEVQVGLHELLGHGSGKVCTEDASGALNFDPATTLDIAGQPTRTWYKGGATWDTTFGAAASAMEECRAEAVGIVLCVEESVWAIFHLGTPAACADTVYVNWLNMARAGLLALQYYNPATGAWGQAHMQARYALLRVMLQAGQGFVTLAGGAEALSSEAVASGAVAEGGGGVHLALDRSKILSVGLPAVRAFLAQLQVVKATADAARGVPLFEALTAVPPAWLPLRALVIAKRRPRQSFVQPVLELAAAAAGRALQLGAVEASAAQGAVVLRTFPGTLQGAIDSYVYRLPAVDQELLALWRAEAHFHKVQ